MILGKAGTDEGDVRKEIWEGALEEVRKGWLQGPFTIDELKKQVGAVVCHFKALWPATS